MHEYAGLSIMFCMSLYSLIVLNVHRQMKQTLGTLVRDLTPVSATNTFTKTVLFRTAVYFIVVLLAILLIGAIVQSLHTHRTEALSEALPTPISIMFSAVLNEQALLIFSVAMGVTGMFALLYTVWLRLKQARRDEYSVMVDVIYPFHVLLLAVPFLAKLFLGV